jgi:hypothetical protein
MSLEFFSDIILLVALWTWGRLSLWQKRVKGKAVPQQARFGPEVSRRFRLPDFRDIRHIKAVRLSASRTGRLYPQEMFLVLIFSMGWVDPRALVRSEGNMSLKIPVAPPGIDPGTVRLVAQRLNHYATPGPQQKRVPCVFPGGKGGRCVRLTTLTISCAVFMKSGNLNVLESSGQLQACDGTAESTPGP